MTDTVHRWQFEVPGYARELDPAKALEAIAINVKPGRAQVMEVWPLMRGPETVTRGKHRGELRVWTGTNQPKTYSFYATEDEARAVARRYLTNTNGLIVYLRNRRTMEYL